MKNKAVKILLGITVSLIVCGGAYYKLHPHNYALVDSKEPTCTEDGYKNFKCWCGAESQETVKAVGHSYQEVIIDATCTEDGKDIYTCSDCGDTYEESIKAIGHNYKEEVTTEPTCTKEGITTFKCRNCGDAFTESIAPLGHSFIDGICERCGELSEDAKKKQEESMKKKQQSGSGSSSQKPSGNSGQTEGQSGNSPTGSDADGAAAWGVPCVEGGDAGICTSYDGGGLTFN